MAAPEARFEGAKKKTEMLEDHVGTLQTDTDYSFS